MKNHVAVLMGGWSSEREVSLTSGRAVSKALKDEGFKVSEIDVDRDLATKLSALKPDVAFNALHGPFGEDGTVQGLLELLAVPYTHSGVLASALAMNKPMAKDIWRNHGLPMANGQVVHRSAFRAGPVMPFPYVIKPLNEGSSVGVHIVFNGDNYQPQDDATWHFGEHVLVEQYIPGREIQIAVMGDRVLGAIEIKAHGRFYDYEAKYTDGKATHLMPAPLPQAIYDEICALALKAHQTLGCRGVTRSDWRYDDTEGGSGKFFLLEINTQPGMTPLSLVPEIAAHQGISFGQLVRWMVEDASCDR
ncbi:D-alanine--D-alanine ligase [Ferrovibrio terrae]|uniref:D-alanine--D-alanine ligase n=1 Tax=Ferrovibrio terrae TaxID=2594003 RepID=A0A516H333_9PROT|nr:D-alanine--D-alanine ligase [Ferrovibrio terrae]QDO98188.1 D-alanine--D-alanine ligase [Ferrovibrio terrae]